MSDAVVVAFDVDGTLTRRDCVRPFLVRVGGWRGIAFAVLRRPLATVVAAARRDRDRMKEIVVGGVMRDREVAVVEEVGERFAHAVMVSGLRSDMVQRLRWHQRKGHHTVLVSASLGTYLRPLSRLLGVDAVLCSDPRRVGERFGDGLAGHNCRGPEKARRLQLWLEEHALQNATLWAYGDSDGDREMLALAQHAEWVRDTTVPAVPAGRDT